MKILFLNHNVIWRSTFYRCFHLGRYLVRRGHAVSLYTIHPSRRRGLEETNLQGVRVVQFPDLLWGIGRSGWDPWDVWHRLRLARRETYDLVHAFDSRPVVIHPALALQRRGLPLVMDWADWWGRGGVIEERRNPLLKFGFGAIETWYEEHFRTRANGTTVISGALRDRAAGLGIDPGTILRLPGGADIENFQVRDARAVRGALGLPEDARILGFMGFVHYDLELVLRAFGLIHRRDPSAKLILTGKPSPVVGRIARELKCADGILDFGVVPYEKISDYMGCADVFLLPFARKQANIGRWPNKVGDYMAMGRPIVSSPVGEMKELFGAEPIGKLAGDNPADFADAAWELLADPEARAAMGRAARQAAEQRYSWEFLAQRLEQFYRSLLGSKFYV